MRFCTNQSNLGREEADQQLLQPRAKIALDVETISLENTLPLGIAVAISPSVGYYFFNPKDDLIAQVVTSSGLALLFNASFDLPILEALGYKIRAWEDVMLLAYSAGILDKSLENLSVSLLRAPYTSVTSQWKKKDQGNIGIDHVKMARMSIQHACNTYALWDKIPKTELYKTIDRPCVDLIIEMEHWGVLIDQPRLTEVEQVAVTRANKLEEELKAELGDINLASNPQCVTALQSIGVLGTRKTKTGADSVGEESLRPLNHPVANKLLEWRSVCKTINTYIPAFRSVDANGRLHTCYGYTNTGRWKSGDKMRKRPNLQNITRNEKFTFEERE